MGKLIEMLAKTVGKAKLAGLFKSKGYKRTAFLAFAMFVAVLRVAGKSDLAGTAEEIGSGVGLSQEQVDVGPAPADLVVIIGGAVSIGHWLLAAFSKDRSEAAALPAEAPAAPPKPPLAG